MLLKKIENAYRAHQQRGADRIFQRNKSMGLESASGVGSTLANTADFRSFLEKCIADYAIKSISDIPCGDWNWMQHVKLDGIEYVGYDVVPGQIADNNANFPHVEFEVFDAISNRPPQRDLIICRDFLFHLSVESGLQALENFRQSGSKYLITTTFDDVSSNKDLGFLQKRKGWGWRKINLDLKPYSMGKPLAEIRENEHCQFRLQRLYKLN